MENPLRQVLIFETVTSKLIKMFKLPTFFILCLSTFAFCGNSQSQRNFLKEDFLKEAADRKKSINELSARLSAFQIKLAGANLGGDASENDGVDPPLSSTRRLYRFGSDRLPLQVDQSQETPLGLDLRPSKEDRVLSVPTLASELSIDAKSSSISPNPSREGFYVLPFIALQGASDLDTNFYGNGIIIEQKVGFSSGWRMGHKWRNFFVEGDFSYFRNDFKDLSGPLVAAILSSGSPLGFFSGEAQGYGAMTNLGLSLDLGSSISIFCGVGGGPFMQEMELKWREEIVDDEQSVLVSQLFSGINIYPSEHMLVGLRYRWLMMGKMESFSEQDLQQLELSLGYIF